MACVASKDSDQPGHSPSLIRVFAVSLGRILSTDCSEVVVLVLLNFGLVLWYKYRSNFSDWSWCRTCEKLKNDKVNKVEKWQKLTAGLNPNHMHIFKPWKKDVRSFRKKGLKSYKELCLQGTHCLYTFIESEVRKWQSSQSKKVTKINSRIISKAHANFKTMEKTCAKFQKDQYKIVWGVALTRYPLSIHFHRIWGQKMTKFTKWKKWQKLMQGLYQNHNYAHLQTMEKSCAKFQNDWYKIVWGVVLTRYPLSIHCHRKMTKFTKWKKWQKIILTTISKSHAHPRTMTKTPAKFQNDWYKELRSQDTQGKCWWMDERMDGPTNGHKLARLSRLC